MHEQRVLELRGWLAILCDRGPAIGPVSVLMHLAAARTLRHVWKRCKCCTAALSERGTFHEPMLIIGSIVKQWPGFITNLALLPA